MRKVVVNILNRCILALLSLCITIILFSATAVHCEDRDPIRVEDTMKKFLKGGQPLELSKLAPKVMQSYIEAIRKLPDFHSCVASHNQNSASTALDYTKIHSLVELEVCLFWLSQEVKDLELLRVFIENSGFHVDPDIQYPKSAMRRYGADDAGILLGAHMSFKNVPSSLTTLLDRIVAPHSLSISILFTRGISPIDTTAIFNRL